MTTIIPAHQVASLRESFFRLAETNIMHERGAAGIPCMCPCPIPDPSPEEPEYSI